MIMNTVEYKYSAFISQPQRRTDCRYWINVVGIYPIFY